MLCEKRIRRTVVHTVFDRARPMRSWSCRVLVRETKRRPARHRRQHSQPFARAHNTPAALITTCAHTRTSHHAVRHTHTHVLRQLGMVLARMQLAPSVVRSARTQLGCAMAFVCTQSRRTTARTDTHGAAPRRARRAAGDIDAVATLTDAATTAHGAAARRMRCCPWRRARRPRCNYLWR